MKKIICLTMLITATSLAVPAQITNVNYIENQAIQDLRIDTYINVKITEFHFRKVNARNNVIEFTKADALQLVQFFMEQDNVLSCESDAINKTVKVISKLPHTDNHISTSTFQHRTMVDVLKPMGYLVTGLKTGSQKMLFEGQTPCDRALLKAGLAKQPCTDCGDADINKTTQHEFESQDYGGDLLLFGDEPAAPVDVNSTSIQTLTLPKPPKSLEVKKEDN
ncbi:MAG: hypothetical protein ACPGXL_05160 [Chitinophagales bacterium]